MDLKRLAIRGDLNSVVEGTDRHRLKQIDLYLCTRFGVGRRLLRYLYIRAGIRDATNLEVFCAAQIVNFDLAALIASEAYFVKTDFFGSRFDFDFDVALQRHRGVRHLRIVGQRRDSSHPMAFLMASVE